MFIIGFVVGVLIGGAVGVFCLGLCAINKESD